MKALSTIIATVLLFSLSACLLAASESGGEYVLSCPEVSVIWENKEFGVNFNERPWEFLFEEKATEAVFEYKQYRLNWTWTRENGDFYSDGDNIPKDLIEMNNAHLIAMKGPAVAIRYNKKSHELRFEYSAVYKNEDERNILWRIRFVTKCLASKDIY